MPNDPGNDKAAISVVIPTLDEVENIDALIARVLRSTGGFEVEIIIVDDGSKDGTVETVKNLEATAPVRLLLRENPAHGLAGAVLAGAELARHEVVVVLDADGSHPPERIPELVRPVLAGTCDLVIGSRYAPGGTTPGWPWKRRLMSRLASACASPLTDVHDALSGFFAARTELLAQIPPDAAGFKIALEVLVRGGDDLRVREIPIAFSDRLRGRSKMDAQVIFTYLRRLLAISGWREGTELARTAVGRGFATAALDAALFLLAMSAGTSLGTANLLSFLVAGGVCAHRKVRQLPAPARSGETFYWRLAAVALLALVLRGGVLASCIQGWNWPLVLAIGPAIGVTALVFFAGFALLVAPVREHYGAGIRWRVASLGVIAFLFALRFFYLDGTELLPTEASLWNQGRKLSLSELEHPPMAALLIQGGTSLFGRTGFGVRAGAVVSWTVAAFFLFRLSRDLFDKTTACRAVMLFSALPVFFAFGIVMTPAVPLVACWAGALWFLSRVYLTGSRSAWLGAGVCFGLGMVSHFAMLTLALAAIIFTLLDAPSRRWLRHPAPYLGALLALVLCSPLLLWNAQNDWASFSLRYSPRDPAAAAMAAAVAGGFSTHKLLLLTLVLLTPTPLLAAGAALLAVKGSSPAAEPAQGPNDVANASHAQRLRFLRVHTLVPVGTVLAVSFLRPVSAGATGVVWLAALPLIAAAMNENGASFGSRLSTSLRPAWVPTLALLILGPGVLLYHLALGWPGFGYSARMHALPAGWRDFAFQTTEAEADLARETGSDPLLVAVGRDRLLNEIAFYRPDLPAFPVTVAGSDVFGNDAPRFQWWSSSAGEIAGRPLVIVGFRRRDVKDRALRECFERLSEPMQGTIMHNDRTVRYFHYRFGYGYRPPRNSEEAAAMPEGARP